MDERPRPEQRQLPRTRPRSTIVESDGSRSEPPYPCDYSLHFGLRRSRKLCTPSLKSALWRIEAFASIPP